MRALDKNVIKRARTLHLQEKKKKLLHSRGTKVEKMLTLAPERY